MDWLLVLRIGAAATLTACSAAPPAATLPPQTIAVAIEGPDRAVATTLPVGATCRGAGRAPGLTWGPPPADARDVLVIAQARSGATHWLVWGLDPDAARLPPGLVAEQAPPLQGVNDAGIIGWLAPCTPPSPSDDLLKIELFVLSSPLLAPPSLDAVALRTRAAPTVIASGEIVLPVWDSP